MKDPREIFFGWLLEKGEPLFTFFEETLHLSQATVVFGPMIPFILIAIVRDFKKAKKHGPY